LDFGGNRDAAAPDSSIKLMETVFGQTDPTVDVTFVNACHQLQHHHPETDGQTEEN